MSLRDLAIELARRSGMTLADAQRTVFAASQRAREAAARVEPGGPEWLRARFSPTPGAPAPASPLRPAPTAPTAPMARTMPPLRDLAISLARQQNIPLADAQRIVYVAAERAAAANRSETK